MLSQIGILGIVINVLFFAALAVLTILSIWALVLSIKALRKYLGHTGVAGANTTHRD